MNPYQFESGTIVINVFSHSLYQILEPDRKGMATLKQIDTGYVTILNACNNPQFFKAQKQLTLFP